MAVIRFATARDASRRVAGVAVAARIVRELSEAGFDSAWVALADGGALDVAAIGDIHRLAGAMQVLSGEPPPGEPVAALPADLLIPAEAIPAFLAGTWNIAGGSIDFSRRDAGAEILRRTGKASDGPVSRWLNRPVSRVLSAMLLTIPGFRPVHATIGTAALALAMFGALVFGGPWGLIAGGLLFHAASVFDGVDGEVARATFRTSQAGAVLDSTIDTATTFMFIIGLATNLTAVGDERAFGLAAWSVALIALGLALIRWRAGTSNLDKLKLHYRDRFTGPVVAKIIAFLTIISSRDFFAFANAAMILVGFPIGPLYGFAVSATVWIVFVAGSVLSPRGAPLPAKNA